MELKSKDRVCGTDEWGKKYKGRVQNDLGVVFDRVTTILTCHPDGSVTKRDGCNHYIKTWVHDA